MLFLPFFMRCIFFTKPIVNLLLQNGLDLIDACGLEL